MQTDDLENRASNHTSLLQYLNYPAQTSHRHFTMPARENGNCSKEIEKGGLLSKHSSSPSFQQPENQSSPYSDPSSSHNIVAEKIHQNGHSHQQPMDRIITSPIALPVFDAPVQPHTNGHSNGHSHRQPMDRIIASPIALPALKVPAQTYTNGHSNGHSNHAGLLSHKHHPSLVKANTSPKSWGGILYVSWLYDQETRRLSVATATTKHRTTFGDILHFFGYTAGATTIISLYMIIPLMILLNAVLPHTWNKPLLALGILALVEFMICIILAKTTPRSKSKRKKE